MENQEINSQKELRFEYIALKEAAKRTGISEFLLRRIVESDKGYVKTIRSGKKWLVEINSLQEALKKGNIAV